MIPAAYLGRGWAFPVRPDPVTRALDLAAGPEKVAQSIQIILDTDPGERAMRPAFGCGLGRFLMEPNTVATRALIQQEVESALAAFEPRIHVTSVNVSPGDDPALVFIAIAYVHIRDQTSANLVFPFYLQ